MRACNGWALSNAFGTGLVLVCNGCAMGNAFSTGLVRAYNGWALRNAYGTGLGRPAMVGICKMPAALVEQCFLHWADSGLQLLGSE